MKSTGGVKSREQGVRLPEETSWDCEGAPARETISNPAVRCLGITLEEIPFSLPVEGHGRPPLSPTRRRHPRDGAWEGRAGCSPPALQSFFSLLGVLQRLMQDLIVGELVPALLTPFLLAATLPLRLGLEERDLEGAEDLVLLL